MERKPKRRTRERILETSLRLFNELRRAERHDDGDLRRDGDQSGQPLLPLPQQGRDRRTRCSRRSSARSRACSPRRVPAARTPRTCGFSCTSCSRRCGATASSTATWTTSCRAIACSRSTSSDARAQGRGGDRAMRRPGRRGRDESGAEGDSRAGDQHGRRRDLLAVVRLRPQPAPPAAGDDLGERRVPGGRPRGAVSRGRARGRCSTAWRRHTSDPERTIHWRRQAMAKGGWTKFPHPDKGYVYDGRGAEEELGPFASWRLRALPEGGGRAGGLAALSTPASSSRRSRPGSTAGGDGHTASRTRRRRSMRTTREVGGEESRAASRR